ncbi:unnamed protein product [Diamesa serratosioi]
MSTDEVLLEWMTHEYFVKVLKEYEGHDVVLEEFSIKSGTNKGENFASSIYRVQLTYIVDETATKKCSFILKTNSANSAISEMLEEFHVFESETQLYKKILVECYKIIGDNMKFAPRLIYADKYAIVLEDLNQLGYELANRKQRLDVNRTKKLLSKLAQFHATTAVLYSKSPELFEAFKSSPFDVEDTPLTFFFQASMVETLETVKTTPELQQYAEKLESFGSNIVEREKAVFSRNPGDKFQVLCHGDLWINNLFFKLNDDREAVDAMMVDYQECFWGSLGIDLNHFFYSSCDFNVHEHHMNDLIEFYHANLALTLKKLQFTDIPTLEEVQQEVRKKSDQALIVLSSIVPVMMIENPEHADPGNFIVDSEETRLIRREVYGNQNFVDVLKFMLPRIAAMEIM